MILNKESFYINESININEKKEKELAILFTDIVESSKAWNKHPAEMISIIEEQSILIDKWSKQNNGFICKTIGDAYMISFTDIKDAIKCGIDIQEDLINNPIKHKDFNLKLRIGIAFGPVYESTVTLQNGIKLKDYFGNTVNTASRIESKVSDENGIAFSLLSENIKELNLDTLLKDYKVDLISFDNKKNNKVNRSERLLTDIHRYYHESIKDLKGIDKVDVYKLTLNKN